MNEKAKAARLSESDNGCFLIHSLDILGLLDSWDLSRRPPRMKAHVTKDKGIRVYHINS